MRRFLLALALALLAGGTARAAIPPLPANAMLEVRWEAVAAHSAGGGSAARVIARVGGARLEIPYATLRDANREGPRVAGRLGLIAASRASLAEVSSGESSGAGALTWRGHIVLLVTRIQAHALEADPAEVAGRWAAALRAAARQAARPGHLPRAVAVPLGETRVIPLPAAWLGIDAFSASVDGVVEARVAADHRELIVTGRSPGLVILHLSHKGREADLEVRVRERAGRIPAEIAVSLTGRDPDVELALDALQRALEQACQPVPGAWLSPYWLGVDGRLVSGAPTCVTAWLEGPGLTPVVASVAVNVRVTPDFFPRPTALAASNHPERVDRDAVLLDQQLGHGNTVYYYHHQNAPSTPEHALEVRLENRSARPMLLLVTESGAGPSRDELYAGHLATWRYLRWMTRGNGWQVRIPAGGSYTLDRRTLTEREVGCGMGQVAVLEGDAPWLVVEALSIGPTEEGVAADPRPAASHSIRGRGLYPTPERELSATYRVGGAYAFIPIGAPPYQQPLDRQGTPNNGNYGVEHRVRIRIENPTPLPQRVYLVFAVAGGLARGSLLVDDRLVETPVLSTREGRPREFGLAAYDMEPGAIREVSVLAFPEPGSNYPVRLVLKNLPANQ